MKKRVLSVLILSLITLASALVLTACGGDNEKTECTHDYTSQVTAEPTCEEKGEKKYACLLCGDNYTEVLPANGHTELALSALAPTCTESGLTEGKHCSVCGEILVAQTVIDSLAHSYNVKNTDGKYIFSEANCEGGAKYFYSCSCGAVGSETFTVGEAKHEYTARLTETKFLASEANCEGGAKYFYSCSCGAVGSETFTVGEANDNHTPDVSGYCTVCDKPISSTEGIIYDMSLDSTYAEVIGYSGSSTKINIADTYNGVPVKNIYDEAFKSTAITKVTIPESVTSIGESAFFGCTGLTSITIPDSVTSIGDWAFECCRSLTSVTVKGDSVNIGLRAFSACNSALYSEYELGTYVGDAENPYAVLIGLTNKNFSSYKINENTKIIAYGVFRDCSRLGTITILDSVTSIGDLAFYGCTGLTSVVIGNGVESIGDWAFYNCTGLTSITIPDSVTSIGSYAFLDCTGLIYNEYDNAYYLGNSSNPYVVLVDAKETSIKSCKMHEDTKFIYSSAFYNCWRLTSITIPDSVTSIGDWAFSDCTGLKSIKYRGTEEQWEVISKDAYWDDETGDYTITYNYTGE